MVTWEGLFEFCMVIAAIIALVIQANIITKRSNRRPLTDAITSF